MGLYGFIVILVEIIKISSASKIFLPNVDETLKIAAANIVNRCFGSSEHWSELLIIPDHTSHEIFEKINHQSKTINTIVFPYNIENNEFTRYTKCNDRLNFNVNCQKSRTTAVLITTHSLKHVKYVLQFLKNNIPSLWRPESYFLIVAEIKCNAVNYNNMLKVIWDYWILNAVILCLSNDPASRNFNKIELYTFNPYSIDHSPEWKTIINETVEVSISPGNFNHSWYIFKKIYTKIVFLDRCSDIFFDKTSNLNGYVIPISVGYSKLLSNRIDSVESKWFAADIKMLKTLSKKLKFDLAQVVNNSTMKYGLLLKNGSYIGMLDDLYTRRSHLAPTVRGLRFYPGLGWTYPHDRSGTCLTSWNAGYRPQWTNLAVAKHIWIGLGLSILFSTLVLYLQNKSHGIVSAFLDAQRLFVGSSIIHTPKFLKHRIILGSIFIVVLVIDGAIKGRFISTLTIARPYPNLETMEQLQQLDIEVYGPFQFKEEIRHPQLKARYNISLVFPACLNITERRYQQRACFVDCRSVRFFASNLSSIYSTRISSYDLLLLTTEHWPMTDRYSLEVQKLVESGIFKKWRFDIFRELEVIGWKLKRATELPYVKVARLNDLQPAFVVLLAGLTVALIVFVLEFFIVLIRKS